MKNTIQTFSNLILLLLLMTTTTIAQELTGYQMPPKGIADLIDAAPTPGLSISPTSDRMLLLDRPNMPGIEEVAQEEMKLAGMRINPRTNGASRSGHYTGMKIKELGKDIEQQVQGLPENAKLGNLSWTRDGSKVAFTNTIANGLELWYVDLATATAKKLTEAVINDAMPGRPLTWFSDDETLLYKRVPANRGALPEVEDKPFGPTIQINEGKKAPVRTYQDLLKNAHDIALFKYYTISQIVTINVKTNTENKMGKTGIVSGMSTSPDGAYVLLQTIQKPFSFMVPYGRFPSSVEIYGKNGKLVKRVADKPLADNIPKGFGAVATGPRSFSWRDDKAATLSWVEAQDGGDPNKEATIRDQLFLLPSPFDKEPEESISFALRYGGVTWGTGDLAMAYEWWWKDRKIITSKWKPDAKDKDKTVFFEHSWEDRYNDPGDFETEQNEYGRSVLMTADKGNTLYLSGQGASPEGNRPFVDVIDVNTKKKERLWRSEAPYYEVPVGILNKEKAVVLSRRESNEERPNYYLRNLKKGTLDQITFFENPYKSLENIQKEMVKYKRADGVELMGTLYLPEGYDREKDGRLPVFMWAYPREFKSANAASQVTDSPYEFIRIGWSSPLFWVTQGYAVMDDFGMPIIGEGENEPNETFIEQLRSGAEAAIDHLVDIGVADRKRIAVGGHSYGAFMTANLLAHTDLFAAGIARSGAYNRTLTPFGFQSEERTFWETPETYFKMSPFNHADKIKEPLLLIHGAADNNSGTFPMQSERFYAALKGHGANVRLVMLPHESHGYRARESVMHMLWEMTEWMDKYVKNRKEITEE
ncbi:MAG: dipeptidyl aminopeptidase/acylaminoacyl peptidase [Polaribacter sp.]|jgi:dipeptidyl aminopeptidase/acylaminoacyl peptidase